MLKVIQGHQNFHCSISHTYITSYYDRIERLHVRNLEPCRLRADLLWCYKVVFGLAHVNVNE